MEQFARAVARLLATYGGKLEELENQLSAELGLPTAMVDAPPVEVTPLLPLTTSKPCEIHKTHVPKSHVNHVHHIWPLGDGGPNVAENRIVVCPTGHMNIHSLLDEYRRCQGTPARFVLSHYATREREMAALGWVRMKQGAL